MKTHFSSPEGDAHIIPHVTNSVVDVDPKPPLRRRRDCRRELRQGHWCSRPIGRFRLFSTQAEALQNYFFLKPQSDSADQVKL